MPAPRTLALDDVPRLLAAVFDAPPVTVYTSHSEFDRDIETFGGATELESQLRAALDARGHAAYAVHYLEARGFVEKERISLDPERCAGHTFRFAMRGWGLIQLQFEAGKGGGAVSCTVSANSEKRANRWFDTVPELRSPSLWDWAVVEGHDRRLQRRLRTLASRRPESARG